MITILLEPWSHFYFLQYSANSVSNYVSPVIGTVTPQGVINSSFYSPKGFLKVPGLHVLHR